MEERYLLYIDILGFSDFVRKSPQSVRRIYKIIEGLNCHNHSDFKVIVFSDTILVYNKFESPGLSYDQYIVMYLIEFAQNLLYSFIGKGFYFRSVIEYGEFEHSHPNNIERFFGKALIKAYLNEKNIQGIGLYISNVCQKYNVIFPVIEHNKLYKFVFLHQTFNELALGRYGRLPVEGSILSNEELEWEVAKDIRFLKDIHSQMVHKNPKVAIKYQSTFAHYMARYPKVMKALKRNNFSLETISIDLDWKPAIKRIEEGYRGNGVIPPTIEALEHIMEEAHDVGRSAAKRVLVTRLGTETPGKGKYFIPFGGAYIILDINGNTKIGRFLLKNCNKDKQWECQVDIYGRGLCLDIHNMHSRQEKAVDEAAYADALKIILSKLKIDGWVESYYS